MDLLHYSSGDEDSARSGNDVPERDIGVPRLQPPEDDSESQSSEDSMDSADRRAMAAEARLRDFGEDATSSGRPLLPAVGALFSAVDGPPSFLDPEATRQIAVSILHGQGTPSENDSSDLPKARVPPGPDFDIALLAPLIKGQVRPGDKRQGAVIEGKAKRYKDDGDAGQIYTAAQIAMMGGSLPVQDARPAAPGAARPPGAAATSAPGPRAPSKAMGVTDFLEKGVGGAQLPRRAQDRKDKEKLKRAAGQSAIGSWKTEAEMVLRQQYDS